MDVWTIPTYRLENLEEDDKQQILSLKSEFLDEVLPTAIGLKFPGFCGNNGAYKEFYSEHLKGLFTPPRGNITSKYCIIGYAPGWSAISFGEPKWLLGPSSETLHKVLLEFDIYPYFTNLFKEPFIENKAVYSQETLKNSLELLSEELAHLEIKKAIFLGKYSEYTDINFDGVQKFVKLHPSYVNRKHSYIQWKESFKEVVG